MLLYLSGKHFIPDGIHFICDSLEISVSLQIAKTFAEQT
mgnify:CR=1 FL=1